MSILAVSTRPTYLEPLTPPVGGYSGFHGRINLKSTVLSVNGTTHGLVGWHQFKRFQNVPMLITANTPGLVAWQFVGFTRWNTAEIKDYRRSMAF